MIKSLNKAYQTDSMYYWCNAEGEVNYPGSGFSTGDSERLPAAVKELYEHYQFSPGCDANLYTVTYSGEDGMLLTTMFNSNWMDVPAVKDAKQKARKALRSIATELTRQCKPWGTVLFGEDTDPEGDEIALFVPAEECASHFEEAGWICLAMPDRTAVEMSRFCASPRRQWLHFMLQRRVTSMAR